MQDLAKELRKKGTPAERALWEHLRGRHLSGLKFRRQHPITTYIVDFCCKELKLIIEIDGKIHLKQKEQDAYREEWLKAHGYEIIRFTNEQVLNNTHEVLQKITKTPL